MTELTIGINPARLSILVVDRNAYHRSLVVEVLRGVGITRVQQAAGALEAIEELQAWHPKLMITEADIDDFDGLELVRRIRGGDIVPNRAMPVILLTARTNRATVEEARLRGVDEFIIKPITPSVLLRRIEEVMRRPRRFVDSPGFVGPCRRRRKVDEYQGARRRLSDPLPGDTADAALEEQKKAVAKTVARLQHLVNDLRPSDRAHVRAIYNVSLEARDTAGATNDTLIQRSTDSLVTYLEGVGATNRLDPEVLGTCLQAVLQLIQIPNSQHEARELVVIGLEKMVRKKLTVGAAPPSGASAHAALAPDDPDGEDPLQRLFGDEAA
jgi:CheY-like chemotaxis protein